MRAILYALESLLPKGKNHSPGLGPVDRLTLAANLKKFRPQSPAQERAVRILRRALQWDLTPEEGGLSERRKGILPLLCRLYVEYGDMIDMDFASTLSQHYSNERYQFARAR